jgi:hypothetical protein
MNPTTDKTIDKEVALAAGAVLKRAVGKAVTRVNSADYAKDALFQTWFCSSANAKVAPEVRKTVSIILNAMDAFLNKTANEVTLQSRATGTNAGLYAYVYPDLGRIREQGQWFIYLGPNFNSKPVPGLGCANVPLLVLAHELSHHFGTNSQAIAKQEVYDGPALDLAKDEPLRAANNADNFGYFIEAVDRLG